MSNLQTAVKRLVGFDSVIVAALHDYAKTAMAYHDKARLEAVESSLPDASDLFAEQAERAGAALQAIQALFQAYDKHLITQLQSPA